MKVLFSKCSEAIDCANNKLGFGCFYSTAGDTNSDIHLHECCEIVFCLSPGKTFFIDERIYDVAPGDIFVINQFEGHKITSVPAKPFERYVLQVHPSYIYDNSTPESNLAHCFDARGENISNRLQLSEHEQKKMHMLFKKLAGDNSFGDDILKNAAVLEILATVNTYFMEKNKNYTYRSSFKNSALETALNYINANYANNISVEEVADNCYMSLSNINALFKRKLGTSAAKYITAKRMTKAKQLLMNGESVASTAEKCGYLDYTSFIRAFKRVTGVSPGRYGKK